MKSHTKMATLFNFCVRTHLRQKPNIVIFLLRTAVYDKGCARAQELLKKQKIVCSESKWLRDLSDFFV